MAQAAKQRRPPARDLVHARGHAEVGAAERRPDAHADGQVQGAALRRQGRGRPALHATLGVPTTFLLTSFYWDNLIYFGDGSQARDRTARWRSPSRWATRSFRHRRRRHRQACAYGIFKRGQEFIGKTVGIAGEHLTGDEMAAALDKALGQEVRYNDVPPEVVPELRLPRRRRSGQHVPVQARLQRLLLRHTRRRRGAPAPSGSAELRGLAGPQRRPHPARVSVGQKLPGHAQERQG